MGGISRGLQKNIRIPEPMHRVCGYQVFLESRFYADLVSRNNSGRGSRL